MKVYRYNIYKVNTIDEVPYKYSSITGKWTNYNGGDIELVPEDNMIILTGADFVRAPGYNWGKASAYYIYKGIDFKIQYSNGYEEFARWNEATQQEVGEYGVKEIFNIMEGTYTGKDMGERSIVANIDFPSRIDFQIGDFVKFDIADLLRANGVQGSHGEEKFYIYTMPTVKKVSSAQSYGKAFQHTVTFYPCQYELATVQMRDVIQDTDQSGVLYTGYDEFSFYGGANTLMKRIMAVLDERFGHTGVEGKDYWSYNIADSINEDKNTALEKFQFDFSGESVMDALLKLNDAEGINTKFFINERMIYVGYKRPYITGVDEHNVQRDIPFEFKYGKTSHKPINLNHGNLFTITKSNGNSSPITRLFAYGAERNLQRFYSSDRIKNGRYVNKLMLPSFEDDGRTDYIDSPEGIARFGIREGTKTFDNIYPSLRFFYYGNLRDVKYCIKLMGSGLESDEDGVYDGGNVISKAALTSEQISKAKAEVDRAQHTEIENTAKVIITVGGVDYQLTVAEADQLINKGSVRLGGTASGLYQYPIARIQCYRVEELTTLDDNNQVVHTGLNRLVESAPPVDLAVFCHATGKVVKCVLYADKNGQTSTQRQLAADGKIPTRTLNGTDYIVGSCFAVHDGHPTQQDHHFECGHTHPEFQYPGLPNSNLRAAWFTDADTIRTDKDGKYYQPYDLYKNQVSIHQIHYTDDHWITDVYEFTDYHQQTFNRQGYSAYCWPRVNNYYPESQSDNIEVNAIVDVGPVMIEDTDLNIADGSRQQTFDIYLRDVGFKINEQTWFGDRVFLFDTCKIAFLDGNLAGYEFEMPTESDSATLGDIYVPALKPDGTPNPEFFDMADNPAQAELAYAKGAFWRIVAKRAETDVDRYFMPNVNVNAKMGDHVVFLDIFMPDIYIRVAEQRLYREAKKYLDANDDGDIQYTFDFDKVRMLKQPIFPLQMREGAIMRVVDDDLDVGMVNDEKTLFDDKNGVVSTVSMYEMSAVQRTTLEVWRNSPGYHVPHTKTINFDTLPADTYKEIAKEEGLTLFYGITTAYDPDSIQYIPVEATNIKSIELIRIEHNRATYRVTFYDTHFLDGIDNSVTVWVMYSYRNYAVLPSGQHRFCQANNLTDFKGGKYYEVVMDALEGDMLAQDTNGVKQMFALVSGLGEGQSFFRPDYTLEDITPEGETSYKRYKVSFQLEESFGGELDYYPSFLYESDGTTESVHVRLFSITERDDEHLGNLNYVDLSIDTITIKFNDNTREKGVSLQDGQEPERLVNHETAMMREVTATVKEESRASAWAQLLNRVSSTEQLQDQTLDFYQALVNAARRHYIELLNLKNNIFDPDGTCKETFLQVMMLQVGADSMNYQLKYTHYGMNGKTSNCGILRGETLQTGEDGKYYDQFFIGNAEEVLDHYVYTEHPTGGEGGRWYPQERNTAWNLEGTEGEGGVIEWPTYFVALKASLNNPQNCHWVCEPIQHTTNELIDDAEDPCFYFNWGILCADADGHYAITETRGNAYMYGDNLICGQISTLAGNSYFDLTHGNFVLAKDAGSPALSYINGVLTISGINDGSENSILVRLGLTEGVANGAASAAADAAAAAAAAAQAAATAQAAVDNVTNDGIISKGTEKQELNREFIIIAGSNRDGEGTDGSYHKNTAQADEYGLDHSALDDAFEDLYAAMKVVLGTSQSTGKIDGSKIQQDTYIGGLKNGTATYDIRQPYGDNMYVGDNPLVLYDGKYYTEIIPEYDKAYMLSIKRVEGDAYALAVIKKTGESTSEDIAMLISRQSGDPTVYTNIKQNINHVSEEIGFRCGTNGGEQSFELTGVNFRPWTDIGVNEFNALWKNYYDAEVELLNRISNAIDEREIGGENLSILEGGKYEESTYFESGGGLITKYIELLPTGVNPQGGGTIRTYLEAGKYIFSAKEVNCLLTRSGGIPAGSVAVTLEAIDRNGNIQSETIGNGENVVVRMVTTTECSFRIKCAYMPSSGYTVQLRFIEIMLQKGTKPTMYQDYVKHLTDALHGSTDIAGGLTMTNLLFLKDENGDVKAGMSGLTDDSTTSGSESEGVAMFAGGTYQEALLQAQAAAQHTLDQLSKLLPILLTKTGYGSRIGCFNVEDENTVYIENAAKTEKITFDTEFGITVSKRSNNSSPYVDMVKMHAGIIQTGTVSTAQISSGSVSFSPTAFNALPATNYPPGYSSAFVLNTAFDTYKLTGSISSITLVIWIPTYTSSDYEHPFSFKLRNISIGLVHVATGRKYVLATHAGLNNAYSTFTSYTFNMSVSSSINRTIQSGEYKFYADIGSATGYSKQNYEGTSYDMKSKLSYPLLDSCQFTGDLYFSSQSGDSIIEIASNGICVRSQYGTMQFLNDKTSGLFAVMSGLPFESATTEVGQVYKTNDGTLKVKTT